MDNVVTIIYVDMNEISNFADGDCAELPNEEAAAMIPVGDQSVADMVEATSKEQKIHREVTQILNAEVSSESKDGVKVMLDDNEMSVDKNAIILSKREPQPPFSVSNPPYLINNAGTFEPLHTRTSPPDAFHYDGHMEYNAHNLYGHMECQATYQSLKEIYGDRTKPFILTRSSFVGTGRYAAKWLGDNGEFLA
jgi:alpha-glucosidase (family GH31 glycosyl hydrolase)